MNSDDKRDQRDERRDSDQHAHPQEQMLTAQSAQGLARHLDVNLALSQSRCDVSLKLASPLLQPVLAHIVLASEPQRHAQEKGLECVGLVAHLRQVGHLEKAIRALDGAIMLAGRPFLQPLEIGVMKLETDRSEFLGVRQPQCRVSNSSIQ